MQLCRNASGSAFVSGSLIFPARNMRHGQSLHEPTRVTIVFRPKVKRPMIRHWAVAQKLRWSFFKRPRNPAFKSKIVIITEKQFVLSNATIDDAVNHSVGRYACPPRHPDRVQPLPHMSKPGPVPVSVSTISIRPVGRSPSTRRFHRRIV